MSGGGEVGSGYGAGASSGGALSEKLKPGRKGGAASMTTQGVRLRAGRESSY